MHNNIQKWNSIWTRQPLESDILARELGSFQRSIACRQFYSVQYNTGPTHKQIQTRIRILLLSPCLSVHNNSSSQTANIKSYDPFLNELRVLMTCQLKATQIMALIQPSHAADPQFYKRSPSYAHRTCSADIFLCFFIWKEKENRRPNLYRTQILKP